MSTKLRNAFGHFATGVTIITTRTPTGEPVGMTVNSFASLSLDPPLVLWSLARTSVNFDVFQAATHFAVHVLGTEQSPLARQFATKDIDRFLDVDDDPLRVGCTAARRVPRVFRVRDARALRRRRPLDHRRPDPRVDERPGDPLLFYRGTICENRDRLTAATIYALASVSS